jgi:prephenate dehydrogenase
MRIVVVGLGLIGGSFCKAIKKYTDHHVIGVDADANTLDLAISMEAVDEVIPMHRMDLLKRGDLVIVAIPPKDIVSFLLENKENFQKGAVVTDVCGVKEYIVNSVSEPLREAGIEFIGAHPMAGTEYAGFTFAKSNMFVNASYLVTPTEKTDREKLEKLKQLAYRIGFKTVLETTPEEHDKSIAYTSQLAHVVSNSYIRSTTLPKEKGFSAGSFLDMTRVARLDENMWCDLFLLNRENLLGEINQLMSHMNDLKVLIESGDREGIRLLLKEGHELKIKNVAEKRIYIEE